MKAMVLAAGKGTRLGRLTRYFPKPMIPIGGKPILEHVLRLLKRQGIRETVINLHHQSDIITGYFGDGRKWGMKIHYSHEPRLLGTAGGVKKAQRYFRRTFLVYYGDNISHYPLNKLIQFHYLRKGVATLGLFPGQEKNPSLSGWVGLNEDGRITEFLEKPDPGLVRGRKGWVNAGIYVLEPSIFRHIPPGRMWDFGKQVFPRLLKEGKRVYGYVSKSYLRGIDNPRRLAQVKREAQRRKRR